MAAEEIDPEAKHKADQAAADAERRRVTEEAIRRIGPLIKGRPCPMCGQVAGWNAEVVGLLVTPLGSPDVVLGSYFPALVLTCKNCSHFSMHGLKAMGVVK